MGAPIWNSIQTDLTTIPFAIWYFVQICIRYAQIYLCHARSPTWLYLDLLTPCPISLVVPWYVFFVLQFVFFEPGSIFIVCSFAQIYYLQSHLRQNLLPSISTETWSTSLNNRLDSIQSPLLLATGALFCHLISSDQV